MLIKPIHTQEITFDNKTKLTLRDVSRVEAGNWTHVLLKGEDKEYIINPDRVLFIKIYKGKKTDYEVV